MRQYFYKTPFLISIFTMVAILFSLCSIAIINSNAIKKILPILSNDYWIVDDLENNYKTIEKYANFFASLPQACTAGIILEDDAACALSSTDNRLDKIKLTEGTIFSSHDYAKKLDTVLLREDMKPLCHIMKGQPYYRYLGIDYKVIGFYKDLQKSSVCSYKYIFNLHSKSLNHTANWSVGFWDMGKEGEEFLSHNEIIINSKLTFYAADSENGMLFSDAIVSNLKLMIMLYIIVAITILLNVFMATRTWLRGKKKEIAIKKMVGASQFQICTWLIISFMSLILISFALGIAIVYLILKIINIWEISPSMVMMFGSQLEWIGIIYAFFIVFIIGLSIISLTLRRYFQNEIIEIVRGE